MSTMLSESTSKVKTSRRRRRLERSGSGWTVGSVQRVVLGVTLTTKARGECYRLRRLLVTSYF